jgi:hypothetical protein
MTAAVRFAGRGGDSAASGAPPGGSLRSSRSATPGELPSGALFELALSGNGGSGQQRLQKQGPPAAGIGSRPGGSGLGAASREALFGPRKEPTGASGRQRG